MKNLKRSSSEIIKMMPGENLVINHKGMKKTRMINKWADTKAVHLAFDNNKKKTLKNNSLFIEKKIHIVGFVNYVEIKYITSIAQRIGDLKT